MVPRLGYGWGTRPWGGGPNPAWGSGEDRRGFAEGQSTLGFAALPWVRDSSCSSRQEAFVAMTNDNNYHLSSLYSCQGLSGLLPINLHTDHLSRYCCPHFSFEKTKAQEGGAT